MIDHPLWPERPCHVFTISNFSDLYDIWRHMFTALKRRRISRQSLVEKEDTSSVSIIDFFFLRKEGDVLIYVTKYCFLGGIVTLELQVNLYSGI